MSEPDESDKVNLFNYFKDIKLHKIQCGTFQGSAIPQLEIFQPIDQRGIMQQLNDNARLLLASNNMTGFNETVKGILLLNEAISNLPAFVTGIIQFTYHGQFLKDVEGAEGDPALILINYIMTEMKHSLEQLI